MCNGKVEEDFGNSSAVRVFYNDMLVQASRGRVLLDWQDLLNSAGGSMGLFLGTSVFGLASVALEWGWGKARCGRRWRESSVLGTKTRRASA